MLAKDMLKVIKDLEQTLKLSIVLGKDALVFVAEKNMIEEFLTFHTKREKERNEIK